uniref:Uncharacterized protein n=1 Tax=Arundo donax TaxID=35708 RepID=A0A0A9BBC9_ARUDO
MQQSEAPHQRRLLFGDRLLPEVHPNGPAEVQSLVRRQLQHIRDLQHQPLQLRGTHGMVQLQVFDKLRDPQGVLRLQPRADAVGS